MNAEQKAEALLHAADRPQSLNDDLYAWAVAAEKLLRTLAAEPAPDAHPRMKSLADSIHNELLAARKEHITDGSPCWCDPDVDYIDPETGAKVIVHKEVQ